MGLDRDWTLEELNGFVTSTARLGALRQYTETEMNMAKAPKALDFASIADRNLADVERPPLPPAGTYIFQCTRAPEITTSQDGKWDIVSFQLKGIEPLDVDPEAMSAFGKVGNVMVTYRIMFNKEDSTEFDRAQFNLKRLLEDHFKIEKGQAFKQGLSSVVNQRVVGTIVWKQDKNDSELYHANISKTAPVEA